MRKDYALALLAVFALGIGGAGCCQKYYDQCNMYMEQAKASVDRAATSVVKAEAAAQAAKVTVPRASAATNKAEAAAARAEDAGARVCAKVKYRKAKKAKRKRAVKWPPAKPKKAKKGKAAEGVSPAPAKPPDFATTDQILDNLEVGNIAYNVPDSMNLENTAIIKLVLSLKKSVAELVQMIEPQAEGKREGGPVKVYSLMVAHLTSADFEVTPIISEEQLLSAQNVNEWKWEIKPKKVGQLKLHLTLNVIINNHQKEITTYTRTINVEVTWKQRTSWFFSNNWQWLCATIIFPLAGYFWWLWKKRNA